MNRQSNLFQEVSPKTIESFFSHALQERKIWNARLLDGGLFNTTYLVEYGVDHKKAVLRLGPINRQWDIASTTTPICIKHVKTN